MAALRKRGRPTPKSRFAVFSSSFETKPARSESRIEPEDFPRAQRKKKMGSSSVKKLQVSLLAGLWALGLTACTTTQEQMGGAGTGVVAGAAVAGPVGAVVGGVAGAISGPSVARAAGLPHHHRHYYWRNGHRYYTYY
jgi:osmotically inducible lipoprotein OsmB